MNYYKNNLDDSEEFKTQAISNGVKTKVMRRVYMIYWFRKLTGSTAIKIYLEVFALWQLGLRTSVGSIFANFWNVVQSGGGVVRYLTSAVAGTELIIQTLFVSVLVLFAWVMRDVFRTRSTAALA